MPRKKMDPVIKARRKLVKDLLEFCKVELSVLTSEDPVEKELTDKALTSIDEQIERVKKLDDPQLFMLYAKIISMMSLSVINGLKKEMEDLTPQLVLIKPVYKTESEDAPDSLDLTKEVKAYVPKKPIAGFDPI